MPKCLCSDLFQHIIYLPISCEYFFCVNWAYFAELMLILVKLILLVGILFFPFLTWFCYHTFRVISKRQANGKFQNAFSNALTRMKTFRIFCETLIRLIWYADNADFFNSCIRYHELCFHFQVGWMDNLSNLQQRFLQSCPCSGK